MSKRRNRLLPSLAAGVLTLFALASGQDIPGIPAIQNDDYLVRLIRLERSEPQYTEFRFTFAVTDKRTGRESTIPLANLTNELRRIEIVNDLLVVFGGIRNTADVVTLLDLQRGEEKDSILCYGPKLSESQRYLIYKKFYPRFAESPATSDLILLYDLQSSRLDNRIGANAESSNPELAGRPIFPETNLREQSTRVWVEDPRERHRIHSRAGYLWRHGDRELVFVDRAKGEDWLVSVDFHEGLDRAQIQRERIPVEEFVDLDPDSPDYATKLKEAKDRFRVKEIRAAAEDVVIISLESGGRFRATEFELSIP